MTHQIAAGGSVVGGMTHSMLTAPETATLAKIAAFKGPTTSWMPSFLRDAADFVSDNLGAATDALFDTSAGHVAQRAVAGVVGLAMDGAAWTVRSGAIFEEYRGDGHAVRGLDDIQYLRIEQIEKTIGYLDGKYMLLAAGSGAGSGAAGLAGIPVSIGSSFGLSLRAVAEYATYHGFDMSLQSERLFALQVLSVASAVDQAAKVAALSQLSKIGMEASKKVVWSKLQQEGFVRAMQQVATQVGIRLTKARLAQIVPVAGAVIGGGMDTLTAHKVCEAALYAYQERFLRRAHGDVLIDRALARR